MIVLMHGLECSPGRTPNEYHVRSYKLMTEYYQIMHRLKDCLAESY